MLHVEQGRCMFDSNLDVRVLLIRDRSLQISINECRRNAIVSHCSCNEVAKNCCCTRSIENQFRQRLEQDVKALFNVGLWEDPAIEVTDQDWGHLSMRWLLLHRHRDCNDQNLVFVVVQIQFLQSIDDLFSVSMIKVLSDDGRNKLLNLILIQRRSNGFEFAIVLRVWIVVGIMRVIFHCLLHSNQLTSRNSPGSFTSCPSCCCSGSCSDTNNSIHYYHNSFSSEGRKKSLTSNDCKRKGIKKWYQRKKERLQFERERESERNGRRDMTWIRLKWPTLRTSISNRVSLAKGLIIPLYTLRKDWRKCIIPWRKNQIHSSNPFWKNKIPIIKLLFLLNRLFFPNRLASFSFLHFPRKFIWLRQSNVSLFLVLSLSFSSKKFQN